MTLCNDSHIATKPMALQVMRTWLTLSSQNPFLLVFRGKREPQIVSMQISVYFIRKRVLTALLLQIHLCVYPKYSGATSKRTEWLGFDQIRKMHSRGLMCGAGRKWYRSFHKGFFFPERVGYIFICLLWLKPSENIDFNCFLWHFFSSDARLQLYDNFREQVFPGLSWSLVCRAKPMTIRISKVDSEKKYLMAHFTF